VSALEAIAYVSNAARGMSEGDLEALLTVSRKRNQLDGITGALLFDNNVFFQYFEGPSESVSNLYDRIRRSMLHSGVYLMMRESIERRAFPNWSMGFTRALAGHEAAAEFLPDRPRVTSRQPRALGALAPVARRDDRRHVDFRHRQHGREHTLPCCGVWSRHRVRQDPRGDLPGNAPAVLAPAAAAFRAAISSQRIPISISFRLARRRHLEGKGFRVLEGWPSIEADAGDAQHREGHDKRVPLFSAGEVGGCALDIAHGTVGKQVCVEAGRRLGGALELQADRGPGAGRAGAHVSPP
jgi:hypothetical protein